MDEILASIRKIIADDPKPAAAAPLPAGASHLAPRSPAADLNGRIEPRLGAAAGPDPAPNGDRRNAADIDRDLADLLDDPAPAAPAAMPPAPEPRLAKPGWLTGKPATPAPVPPPDEMASAPRPLPLTAKLEQARSEVRQTTPLPRPSAGPAAPNGFRAPAPAPAAAPAPVRTAAPAPAPAPAEAKPVETRPADGKRADAVPGAPASMPALHALANLAENKPVGTPRPLPDAAPPIAETKAPAVETTPPAPAADAGPAPLPSAAPAAEPVAAATPPKPVAAAAFTAPALTAEAIVAALPSSRPLGPSADATVRSVEDLIADLLRPMLRQWLDENMPRIVEKALRIELANGLKLPTLPGAVAVSDKPADKA